MAFKLTPHAAQRLLERTSLSEEEATTLLNVGGTVFAGHQPEDNRVHMLLYSDVDNRFFVAVANMRDEAVVTVLTLSQYEAKYDFVDKSRLLRAKAIAIPGTPRTSRGLSVSCRYVGLDGIIRVRSLGRAESFSPITPPEVLATDADFKNLVGFLCSARGIEWERLIDVSVRECAHDSPKLVPIDLPGRELAFRIRWLDTVEVIPNDCPPRCLSIFVRGLSNVTSYV
jgi:hypothetical protein